MGNLKTKGEWGFLHQLLPHLRQFNAHRFIVPPGDDAALLKTPPRTVLSIDGLTEGTHFKSSWARPLKKIAGVGLGRALGWKLLGSGLSDLAAMGRTQSRWAMVYLAAPASTSMDFLMDLYRGVRETCERYDTALVGGDTVRGRELSLVVAVGAEMISRPLTRTGAKAGDALCIVGPVGDAQMGLKMAQKYFVTRFFKVKPRFKEAHVLAGFSGVTSLMDLSDPLASSVKILADASGVGAHVWAGKIPVSAELKKTSPSLVTLLGAGEDYGLLFTARQSEVPKLKKKLSFAVVGKIEPRSRGIHFYDKDKKIHLHRTFEHFA